MAVVQLEAGDSHQPENGFVAPDTAAPPGPLTRIDAQVLPFLGGFGRYQKQLIVLTWIPALFIGFSQYSDNFLLAQPDDIVCVQPNLTADHGGGGTLPTFPSALPGDAGVTTVSPNTSMQCVPNCSEWTFKLHTGLVENVVTKVKLSILRRMRDWMPYASRGSYPLCS